MYIEQLDENIPGAPTYLKSLDSGKTTLLHDCAAQKILTLKVAAPVMLIWNLTYGLYNGCIGKVYSISEDQVVVNFNGRLVETLKDAYLRYMILPVKIYYPHVYSIRCA